MQKQEYDTMKLSQESLAKRRRRIKLKENIGTDKMQPYYDELHNMLVDGGFKSGEKKV